MDVTLKSSGTGYLGPSEINSSSLAADPDQQNSPQTHVESSVSLVHDVVLTFAKEAVASRDLTQDLAASVNWNDGKGLFSGWSERVSGALNAAYPTFLHLLSGGDAAVEKAISHPYFKDRKRKLKKANPALIALYLAAKPKDAAQRSACSEYAVMLIWATQNKVGPSDFIKRMEDVTLKRCKMEVRTRRRVNKPAETSESTGSANSETRRTVPREASAAVPALSAAASKTEAASEADAAETDYAGRTKSSNSTPTAKAPDDAGAQPRIARELTLTVRSRQGKTRDLACPLKPKELKLLFSAFDAQTSPRSALRLFKSLVASLEKSKRPPNKNAARA